MPQLWDILADGGEHRSIIQVNGDGRLGVSLGTDVEDQFTVDKGDTVGVSIDEEERSMTVYFGPDQY